MRRAGARTPAAADPLPAPPRARRAAGPAARRSRRGSPLEHVPQEGRVGHGGAAAAVGPVVVPRRHGPARACSARRPHRPPLTQRARDVTGGRGSAPRPAPPRGGESRAEPSPAARGGDSGRSRRLERGREAPREGGGTEAGLRRDLRAARRAWRPRRPRAATVPHEGSARAGAVTMTGPYGIPARGAGVSRRAESVSLTSKRRLCTIAGERRDTEGNKTL